MVQRIGLDLATPIRTFDVARENTRQQEQRNALSRFLPAALLEGDRDALNQLVAANPQAALQVFGIQEQQKARKAADVRSDRAFAENIRQFDVQLKDKRAARAATAQAVLPVPEEGVSPSPRSKNPRASVAMISAIVKQSWTSTR